MFLVNTSLLCTESVFFGVCVGGAHCGYQLCLSSMIIVSTHVPFGALPHVCFSGYFCNVSLADIVSLVKSAKGQIIGLEL